MIKNIFTFIIFFTISISNAISADGDSRRSIQDILERNDLSIAEIQNSGHQILLGEFTGIGGKIEMADIRMFITKKDLFYIEDVEDIQLKRPSGKFNFSNLARLLINARTISKKEIKGLVIRN